MYLISGILTIALAWWFLPDSRQFIEVISCLMIGVLILISPAFYQLYKDGYR